LEEEISEVKLTYKEKIKRQKEEFNKKLLQLGEEKELLCREMAQESR